MTVAVLISKAAQKDFNGLPASVQASVNDMFLALANYPNVTGIKALKGGMKGLLRARVGNYRVVFTLTTGTITVVQITDRKETY